MNKIYSLLTFSILFAASSMAQPILTGANTNPTAGQNITEHTAAWQSPGAAGASVTWNYATLASTGTTTFTYVTPSSTPYNSNFTGATLAMTNPAQDTYYAANSSSNSLVGAYSITNNYPIPYSDPEKQMQYPCTYNTTYNDNLLATYTANTLNFIRSGTCTGTADAYGTLILPYGTLTNVLRFHFQEDYKDTVTSLLGVHYIGDYYMWYLPGTHAPVLEFGTFSISGNPSTFAYFIDQASLGVQDESLVLTDLNLFPNPSVNGSDLNFSVKKTSDVKLSVVNMEGQVIIDEPMETLTAGDHTYHIDLQNYAAGIYMIKLEADGKAVTRKLIKE